MGRHLIKAARFLPPALVLFFLLAPPTTGGAPPGELLRAKQGEKLSQEELRKLFLTSEGGSTRKPASPAKPAAKPTPKRTPPPPKASPKPLVPPAGTSSSPVTKPGSPIPRPTPPQRAGTGVREVDHSPPHTTLLVRKEGLVDDAEEDVEEEEPPQPKKKPRFWLFSLGRSDQEARRWRHLTPALRRELDKINVRRGRWRYVIVHNSGSRNGNARIFDYYHRRVRKMRNGMAYHFVIGNGSASRMGQIEIGDRWRRQINGGHVASDRMNEIGIGVCLVGDFNKYAPPPEQLEALRELIAYLRERAGKRRGTAIEVKGHKEVNPPRRSTDCPGDRFDLRLIHKM